MTTKELLKKYENNLLIINQEYELKLNNFHFDLFKDVTSIISDYIDNHNLKEDMIVCTNTLLDRGYCCGLYRGYVIYNDENFVESSRYKNLSTKDLFYILKFMSKVTDVDKRFLIKIKEGVDKNYWYSDYIGKELSVFDKGHTMYYLNDLQGIYKTDVEVIKEII